MWLSQFVVAPLVQLKLAEGDSLALTEGAVTEVYFPTESSSTAFKIRIPASNTEKYVYIRETEGRAVLGLDGVWQAQTKCSLWAQLQLSLSLDLLFFPACVTSFPWLARAPGAELGAPGLSGGDTPGALRGSGEGLSLQVRTS